MEQSTHFLSNLQVPFLKGLLLLKVRLTLDLTLFDTVFVPVNCSWTHHLLLYSCSPFMWCPMNCNSPFFWYWLLVHSVYSFPVPRKYFRNITFHGIVTYLCALDSLSSIQVRVSVLRIRNISVLSLLYRTKVL